MQVLDVLRLGPVIPVIVIDDASVAVPLAQALVSGGVRVLEVTLRTPAALDAIRAMSAVEGAVVGAGTVTNAVQLAQVKDAGACFAVSPGLTPVLAEAAKTLDFDLLPGTATASEVMAAREAGFRCVKFFPAECSGGVAVLKAFASVFKDVTFCPTGGISAKTAPGYLALANVACVGGSWLTPPDAMRAHDWKRIAALAREATALRAGPQV